MIPMPSDDTDQMQQEPNDATIDPVSVVQGALAYGRKQMGLPESFYGETQQSFDDGGEVMPEDDQGMIPQEDQGADVTGGGNMSQGQQPVDPRATLAYLTGHGALSPDIAAALEQNVDPQGTMDPAERKLKALSATQNPATQFGLLQAYRQKYNAYSGYAKAALTGSQNKPPNMGTAAAAATQAFAHLPTGYSVKFAPAGGQFAMTAKKLGGAQPAYDDGGIVIDATNPSAILKESGDINDEEVPSYDKGGVVDEEDTLQDDNGVIPENATETSGMLPASSDDEGTVPVTSDAEGMAAPVMVSPQQVKGMLDAGYDKPVESGWVKFLKNIMGYGETPAELPQTSAQWAPGLADRMLSHTQVLPQDSSRWFGGTPARVEPQQQGAPQPAAPPAPQQPAPQQQGAPQQQPAPQQQGGQPQREGVEEFEQRMLAKDKDERETNAAGQAARRTGPTIIEGGRVVRQGRQEQRQQQVPGGSTEGGNFEKYIAQAHRLFPGAAQGNPEAQAKFHQYVTDMMKVDVATSERERAANARLDSQDRLLQQREKGLNARNEAGLKQKEQAQRINTVRLMQQAYEKEAAARGETVTPDAVIKYITPLVRGLGMGPGFVSQVVTGQGGSQGDGYNGSRDPGGNIIRLGGKNWHETTTGVYQEE